MHLTDNIFLLCSFMNTHDTFFFLMACVVNPLTCVYAEGPPDFFVPASLPSRVYAGDSLTYSVFLF